MTSGRSKIDFIQDFPSVSNCKIICKQSHTIATHKIILAVSGTFLRDLIKDIPVADEVTLLMKDYEAAEVLEILDLEGPDPRLRPITKLEPEEIKEETDLWGSEESELEEEEIQMKNRKKKDIPKTQKVGVYFTELDQSSCSFAGEER